MIDAELFNWVTVFAGTTGVCWERVSVGKNNAAFKLSVNGTPFFVKQYHKADLSRFEREVGFLTLLNKKCIKLVPELIATNREIGAAILSHIPGALPEKVTSDLIRQSAQFIGLINDAPSGQSKTSSIRFARGSLMSGESFFSDIDQRIDSLLQLNAVDEVDSIMQQFVRNNVIPEFTKLKKLCGAISADKANFEAILSPSDFGFHNTLLDNSLRFVDFEYAGWDSAEKLTCDFFAQPRYVLSHEHLSEFIQLAFPYHSNPLGISQHCKLLAPVTNLKWCLIFLNEFKVQEGCRRAFSANQTVGLQNKLLQLRKSQNRLQYVAKMSGELL